MNVQAPEFMAGHFVCTDGSVGLTEEDAQAASVMLEMQLARVSKYDP